MSEIDDNKATEDTEELEIGEEASLKPRPKRGISMLFPIIVIAAGVFLLLAAFDLLPELHWEALLQLWPLLLIFIGLDIIIRLLPHPLGTILSLVLALIAVGLFAYVLLYADEVPILNEIVDETAGEARSEHISYTADGVDTADISIDLGSRGAALSTLEDSENLLEADVSYVGELVFDTSTTDGLAAVVLAESVSSDWRYWINPIHWFDQDGDRRWQIALHADIPTNLDLDLGSGSTELDLQDLTLTALNIEGGSGSVDMTLPGGDYDMAYDAGSGSVIITLPAAGRHEFLLESGSGSVIFLLPSTLEAMVVVEDKGSGGLRLNSSLFNQIEFGDDGEGVWVTAGYEDTSDRVTLVLDTGSGSVEIDRQ